MNKTLKWAIEQDPALIKYDGFDDCIIGICNRFGQESILAYDYEKIIRKLMLMGMERSEAVDFFEYNQIGMYVGERTPCFIERP